MVSLADSISSFILETFIEYIIFLCLDVCTKSNLREARTNEEKATIWKVECYILLVFSLIKFCYNWCVPWFLLTTSACCYISAEGISLRGFVGKTSTVGLHSAWWCIRYVGTGFAWLWLVLVSQLGLAIDSLLHKIFPQQQQLEQAALPRLVSLRSSIVSAVESVVSFLHWIYISLLGWHSELWEGYLHHTNTYTLPGNSQGHTYSQISSPRENSMREIRETSVLLPPFGNSSEYFRDNTSSSSHYPITRRTLCSGDLGYSRTMPSRQNCLHTSPYVDINSMNIDQSNIHNYRNEIKHPSRSLFDSNMNKPGSDAGLIKLFKTMNPLKSNENLNPSGFKNYGSNCFMNAALQCLLRTPQMCKLLRESWLHPDYNRNCSERELFENFLLLYEDWSVDNVKPQMLNIFLKSCHYVLPELFNEHQIEQDVQEFTTKFLSLLHKILRGKHSTDTVQKKRSKIGLSFLQLDTWNTISKEANETWTSFIRNSSSVITDLFYGQKVHLHVNTADSTTSIDLQSFNCLQLQFVHNNLSTVHPLYLEDLLYSFNLTKNEYDRTKLENSVQGKNSVHFEVLTNLPRCLILHLLRFRTDLRKVHHHVFVPLRGLRVPVFNQPEAYWPTYSLYGIVCHIGNSINRGHYVAYAAGSFNGRWFKFDDEKVQAVDIEQEMLQDFVQENCYLLFYRMEDVS